MSFQTRDFERLYTGLPQRDVVDRLSGLITAVWHLHPQQPFLLISATGHEWLDATHLPREARGGAAISFRIGRQSHYLFTFARAVQLTTLLVSQSYFRVGDAVFSQAEGIPMGLNPCIYFAKYYLFSYELQFARQVVHSRPDAAL